MYRIKEAAARAGVSVELLRAWERRYGVVHPDRTASGYRVYDEPAIERLRAMRHLVDDGWSPSAASDSIRTSDAGRVHDLAQSSAAGTHPEVATPTATGPTVDQAGSTGDPLIDRFVEAAAALDSDGLEAVLDAIFARGSFEAVMDTLLFPALRRLGDAWAAGGMDVAAEHAATHAVLRRLGAAFQAAGRPSHEPPILVGLPPESRHEIGALAVAIAARRAGLAVLYLGADLPAVDWVDAASTSRARAAVVGVPTAADRAAAEGVVAALQEARPGLVIALGGAGLEPLETSDDRVADLATGVKPGDGPIRLPAGLADAVEAIRSSLGRRSRTP